MKLYKEKPSFRTASLGMNSFGDRLLGILPFALHSVGSTSDTRSSLARTMACVACTHSLHGTVFLCRLKLRTKTGSSKAAMQFRRTALIRNAAGPEVATTGRSMRL